ncbi:phasin family protein [Alkalicoccus urumqiensis]|uniref:Polyhydroxyalkanoate synthesis regulator n=1 Tax=Alkalicoccus urumqiensis TaxID=1548213 RepID=A0A2P6MEF0_ALKUR|nr:hypothetical protein [Alkalicoccus urumqiensis]PRO64674.1 hypothetical protein C6I21_13285 [Alkalicoccus urumqiensis]
MNNVLKTGFLLGLGAAVSSKEKVDRYMDDLLAKGKVTPAEADDLYNQLLQKGSETEEGWERRSREKLRLMLRDLDMVPREDLDALQARVQSLEARLESLEKKQNDGNNPPS